MINIHMWLKEVRAVTHHWVRQECTIAGFSSASLCNQPLIIRHALTGGLWYLGAIMALLFASLAPDDSQVSIYVAKGMADTLSPILWNIVATVGLLGFGITLLLPNIAVVIQSSRHLLISAYIMGCLMLATLTFQYASFLGSPAEHFGEYYWLLVPLSGLLLAACYLLNFSIVYVAVLLHPKAGFMQPLRHLSPSLRIGGAMLVFSAISFGVVNTSV